MPESSTKRKSKNVLHRDKAADVAFGAVLKRHRATRGLTQEQLAWETKIERGFISELERGLKGPSLLTILRLARALDVEPGILVNETALRLRKSSSPARS
jgi:transcriptional regulator with XRE-family HTH domain